MPPRVGDKPRSIPTFPPVKKALSLVVWFIIALLGAGAYAAIAFKRGEPLNSGYILAAALCTYAIGYRFYSKWIAAKVLALDDRRATPCEIHEDGRDFVKTNKWIVFGHHFAAISGPGPLVGPVLAAQFGYLPGTLWILIGVVLGGAVQDFIILAASMRRDGRSLGLMVRDELNGFAGLIGSLAILAIMVILLAVLGLVVVNALAESPWGIFTVGATLPIAIFMGCFLRFWRVGKVLEVSVIGVVLLLLAVWGGQLVHASPAWSKALTFKAEPIAWALIIYGLLASVLPVWLVLAPRDYLSTFMKLGTIALLVLGVFLVLPSLHMPAVSVFAENGKGLVVAGGLFPFCFITIACGAISGFHTLIASGITPKIIARESHARSVGYGAMCLESLVAIMAMIAACTLEPETYLAMNTKGKGKDVVTVTAGIRKLVDGAQFTALAQGADGKWALSPVAASDARMRELSTTVGEPVKEDPDPKNERAGLYGRTGGAATLAVGMANIFSRVTQGRWLDLWYHFAIMFEALFILTTLDAGTRVGRYLFQGLLGQLSPRLGDTARVSSNLFASALVVAGWGYFLIQGVNDPLGGINSLWPLFGIANQLLAAIALCLGTTIILKSQLAREGGRKALALVTIVPLVWLLTVTMTAGLEKIFHRDPKVGFLAGANALEAARPTLEKAVADAKKSGDAKQIQFTERELKAQPRLVFNNRMDAVVAGTFLAMVALIVLSALREWWLLLARTKEPTLSETQPVWLPAGHTAANPSAALSAIAIGALLIKEVSGEAAIERERAAQACECAKDPTKARRNVFLSATERQFRSPNRCC